MLKLNFWREKDKPFKRIAHGLVPAASIAPKAAVPRTPPPRSPASSPERPRSALAAAILSSSLTGQTWALPPARARSFSESDQSESLLSEHISTAIYTRDRWSEGFVLRPRLSSFDHSEEEMQHQEAEEEVEEDKGGSMEEKEYVYQTLDRQKKFSDTGATVYALPLKHLMSSPRSSPMLASRESSREFQSENVIGASKSKKKRTKDSTSHREDRPSTSQSKEPKARRCPSRETSIVTEDGEAVKALKDKNAMLEEKLRHLEEEVNRGGAQPIRTSATSMQAELWDARQQAQELVDENDALKRSVHRLSMELSAYQTKYRPLSKQESSRLSSLPKTGSPPPWLVDMKYLSPLMLAYEDMLNDKETLLRTAEEEVRKLRVHVEEVVKENERFHCQMAKKTEGFSQEDCNQVQQQALLVLQENQLLIEQMEALNAKNEDEHSKRLSEVSRASKQLILLEAENQRLREEADKSRREARESEREALAQRTRLKDAITWEEHCSIAVKLRRQLEQEQSRNKNEADEAHVLRYQNQSLQADKTKLMAAVERIQAELKSCRQANRRTERRLIALKQQKDECVLKEGKTRTYLEAVVSVADHISQERDQLLHMASILQQEKQGFIGSILSGTVRFGKLQERVKVYRRLASSRLAALEEAAAGKAASHHREMVHLQRLLGERQQAEERLLQSKREVEEELEEVWQAATRENQQIMETLWDSGPTCDIPHRAFPDTVPPEHPLSFLRDDKIPKAQDSDEKHQQDLDFYS
ncbi:centrosomal protein of 89 kDa isoform X1 [Phyllopteryx taeniolatus]|uniref:centrosomal protein of 89 kDa isoform X1 n=2 Tax=Phyllopteryx taeniolatus TaxID=161469 RepID=UPI002AD5165F|nr:centrosomal protein of 89 kDa isoform X1 [Phyllopteryx taeniolatus]